MNEYEILCRMTKGCSLLALPDDYTVIDLETTGFSPYNDEIIELAALKVRNGIVQGSYQQLVKPKEAISDFIESTTHITNEMVADAPSIEDVLYDYLDFIGSDIVVGHNVSFDVNFLFDNCVALGGDGFSNDYINTVRIAKRLVDIPHYRLSDLCTYFHICQDNAHRALADCQMTHTLFVMLKEKFKEIGCDESQKCLMSEHKSEKRFLHIDVRLIECQIPEEEIDHSNPLYGKKVVFTGALSRFKREAAMQLVANLGGKNQDSVTRETDYLVLGNFDYSTNVKDGKSSKLKKAEAYALKGTGITIMDEQTFYDMVEAGDD